MRRLLTALGALSLLLAGCGDDDDAATPDTDTVADTEPDTVTDTEPGTESGAEPGAESDTDVAISDFSFEPDTIEMTAGEAVTWTNQDGVAHTVTAGTPGSATGVFDESLDPDASAEVSFDEAGTFDYFCAIHPTMTGQVVVS